MDRPHGQNPAPGVVVLGRYEVLDRIGSGGFGVVWRAHDTLLGREVALKRVARGDEDEHDDGDRVLREGRALARVAHPGVVAIHDMVLDEDAVWLVLELVPGSSLDLVVAREGRRPPEEVARLGAALARALAHGHAGGLVHRDVKPANVLVDDRGGPEGVKLADYGIARLVEGDDPTVSRRRHGSLPWASPEWARNEEITASSDVFSLGATLFHAVEGHPPFADEEPGRALVLEVAAGRVLPARHAGPLTGLLHRMLDARPAARPGAAEVAAALTAMAGHGGEEGDDAHRTAEAPAPPVPAAAPSAPSAPRRRRAVLVATAAVVVVAVVAGALWLTGATPAAEDPLALPDGGLAPVSFTGDERDADPCAVVDPSALARFGEAMITPGPYLSACTLDLRRPGSAGASRLVVDLFRGDDSSATDDRRPLGAGFVVRRPASEGCRSTVTLAVDISIALRTTSDDPAVDACRLGDAAVALTVRGLNEHGLVTVPGRTSGWPLAVVDACTLATRSSLATVGLAGQLAGPQSNGWGRWDCRWGRGDAGIPAVDVVLRLESGTDVLGRGPRSLVAGRPVVTEVGDGDQNPRRCTVAALWRPVERPAGLFQVVEAAVDAPLDDARLCAAATRIATTGVDLLDARR